MKISLNIYKKIFSFGLVSFLILVPILFLNAATTAVQSGITTKCTTGSTSTTDSTNDVPCDSFDQLVTAVKNVINSVIALALGFSVIVIAKAGWLYLNSGGQAAKRTEANQMFEKVAWGIFWIIAAWTVVNIIITNLVNSSLITKIWQ